MTTKLSSLYYSLPPQGEGKLLLFSHRQRAVMLPLGLSGSEKENIKEEERNEKRQNASQSSRCWADKKPKLTTLGQPKEVEVLRTGVGVGEAPMC